MSNRNHRRAVDLLTQPCSTPEQLHRWVRVFLNLRVPRVAVCPRHDPPFHYLLHAYFEPTKDVVVWAPRGGGKTRLAAVATLLDLLHKPGCEARILGGSLEQSLRMWEHLLPDVERIAAGMIGKGRRSSRRVSLSNGSRCAVLTQSQRAVRGLRVQKLRCDEVEMFKPDVWEAAQLVTRSNRGISGAIEAISTLHSPFGLMSRIVDDAKRTGTRLIRWCLLDVLERCLPERDCATCPLWPECQGIAKVKCAGFIPIDDAIAMKQRVGLDTWEAEMLCRRPSVRGCVFPRFAVAVHVRESTVGGRRTEAHVPAIPPSAEHRGPNADSLALAIDFGFAAPFVCLWIERRADGTTYVFDEYVQEQRTTPEHIEQIEARPWGKVRHVYCDPAGAGRNDQTAASNVQVLRSAGYTVHTRRSLIQEGIELIRSALTPASGSPKLFIHPRCTRLIRAMQSYRYSPNGGEVPVKDGTHDHPLDALRYYFVNTAARGEVRSRGY